MAPSLLPSFSNPCDTLTCRYSCIHSFRRILEPYSKRGTVSPAPEVLLANLFANAQETSLHSQHLWKSKLSSRPSLGLALRLVTEW